MGYARGQLSWSSSLCTPSLFPCGVRGRKSLDSASTAQQQLRHPCVFNTICSTDTKHSHIPTTVRKIICTKAKRPVQPHFLSPVSLVCASGWLTNIVPDTFHWLLPSSVATHKLLGSVSLKEMNQTWVKDNFWLPERLKISPSPYEKPTNAAGFFYFKKGHMNL